MSTLRKIMRIPVLGGEKKNALGETLPGYVFRKEARGCSPQAEPIKREAPSARHALGAVCFPIFSTAIRGAWCSV